MRARYMDPVTGRFISQDPAKNGVNWFSYCGNNPVNAIDQTGTFITIPGLLGALDFLSKITTAIQFLGTIYSLYALFEFVGATEQAKDSLPVEEAWGEFMSKWSTTNDPTNLFGSDALGMFATTVGIIASYLGTSLAGVGKSRATTLALIGANMAILEYGYTVRLGFYINQIDME